jgi:hypothetical protein
MSFCQALKFSFCDEANDRLQKWDWNSNLAGLLWGIRGMWRIAFHIPACAHANTFIMACFRQLFQPGGNCIEMPQASIFG